MGHNLAALLESLSPNSYICAISGSVLIDFSPHYKLYFLSSIHPW